MRTIHDLVNNALNNLQIVRLDLEDLLLLNLSINSTRNSGHCREPENTE